jgi:hypothetical protein
MGTLFAHRASARALLVRSRDDPPVRPQRAQARVVAPNSAVEPRPKPR